MSDMLKRQTAKDSNVRSQKRPAFFHGLVIVEKVLATKFKLCSPLRA